jgi:hypothetical protein
MTQEDPRAAHARMLFSVQSLQMKLGYGHARDNLLYELLHYVRHPEDGQMRLKREVALLIAPAHQDGVLKQLLAIAGQALAGPFGGKEGCR